MICSLVDVQVHYVKHLVRCSKYINYRKHLTTLDFPSSFPTKIIAPPVRPGLTQLLLADGDDLLRRRAELRDAAMRPLQAEPHWGGGTTGDQGSQWAIGGIIKDGFWMVFGWFLDGVWMVFGCFLVVFGCFW